MKKDKILFLRARLLLAGAVFLCSMATFSQSTREVNQNDPNAPYQTIRAAVTDALPGDTILVHPGTYQEQVTISGITLKALRGPEVTVIQSPDGTGDGVTLTGNQSVTLQDFRVQGFAKGIVIASSGGSTKVANCIATGNSSDGIYLRVSAPFSSKIVNNISADNGGSGFSADPPEREVFYSSVFNNISFRNGSYGFAYDTGATSIFTYGDYNCSSGNSKGAYFLWGPFGAVTSGPHSITTDPLLDASKHYRFTSQSSPSVNTGNPATFYNDPDGSRNDMGAYGGPEARLWWRDPFTGPTIDNVTVDPPQVRPGGQIVIRATARTE